MNNLFIKNCGMKGKIKLINDLFWHQQSEFKKKNYNLQSSMKTNYWKQANPISIQKLWSSFPMSRIAKSKIGSLSGFSVL